MEEGETTNHLTTDQAEPLYLELYQAKVPLVGPIAAGLGLC